MHVTGNSPLPVRSPAATVLQPRTLLLATDLQQSILAELDRSGPNLRAYTPYGSPSSLRPTSAGLGFNGQLKERPTGWYHLGNGHRVYNPLLIRFHSPDRLSPFGKGGLNPYAYCSGSPMNRVDPSGRAWLSLLGNVVGTALNSIFAGAAINRAAAAIVAGKPQSMLTRIGNAMSFWGGRDECAVSCNRCSCGGGCADARYQYVAGFERGGHCRPGSDGGRCAQAELRYCSDMDGHRRQQWAVKVACVVGGDQGGQWVEPAPQASAGSGAGESS